MKSEISTVYTGKAINFYLNASAIRLTELLQAEILLH